MTAPSYNLNRRVSIMQRAAGTDDEGESLPWSEMRKAWASEPKSPTGMQVIKANAVNSVVKVSIRLRWCTDVVAGMRVADAGAEYNIVAVLPLAGRRFVDLACEVLT